MEFIFSCSHLISHLFSALTHSISLCTLEDKLNISARPCIILYLYDATNVMFNNIFTLLAAGIKSTVFGINYKKYTISQNLVNKLKIKIRFI